jgi:hypothetical protein
MTYAVLRFVGIGQVAGGDYATRVNFWAVDILALGAMLLFPRLAFSMLSDNVFVLYVVCASLHRAHIDYSQSLAGDVDAIRLPHGAGRVVVRSPT